MRVVSLVHQKGGTGKSTLAVALAASLAARQQRVLLLDTDYQGTCMDWGSRFGERLHVPVRSCVQPGSLAEAARQAQALDWLVVDGAAGLSPMTESVLALGGRALVPIRPAWPDVWALPWLAAL
ncbi:MAG TPA: AAA family ATPase, partial [bacterium]|nr:AAA family ATPase [bacterium]